MQILRRIGGVPKSKMGKLVINVIIMQSCLIKRNQVFTNVSILKQY